MVAFVVEDILTGILERLNLFLRTFSGIDSTPRGAGSLRVEPGARAELGLHHLRGVKLTVTVSIALLIRPECWNEGERSGFFAGSTFA